MGPEEVKPTPLYSPSGPEPSASGVAPRRERAITALEWAADVATKDARLIEVVPPKPTLEDLRAITIDDFRRETDRLLMGKNAEEGLDALLKTGALDVWMPEVAALVGFGDGEWRHKDVWKHTKQVVRQSVPRLAVRWGALLHDIGKVKTRSIEPNGEVHFFGHSEVGASMFRKRVAKRLGFEDDMYDRVHFLILHHLRASQYDGQWTDSAVRRFSRELSDGLTDLLDLSRADITTKRPEKRKRGLRQISELASRIREIQEVDSQVPPLPKGVGTAIMQTFGLEPSRKIGDLKRTLEEAIARGELEGRKEDEYYVAWLAERRSELGF